MKNIIGIIGSPRRMSNTHILVDKILKGTEYNDAQINEVFLNDCNKDDMNLLYSNN